MMMQLAGLILPSASSNGGNGVFSRIRKLRSSITSMASVTPATACPTTSRFDQREIEAMQSFDLTGSPSWNLSPSRSLNT
jgi:hypothetical protein